MNCRYAQVVVNVTRRNLIGHNAAKFAKTVITLFANDKVEDNMSCVAKV